MRDYSRVSPKFWVGDTGRTIRELGPEAQLLALYLMTSPHANMIGLYYVPIAYMSHETGMPEARCRELLGALVEVGFCGYDGVAEVVWVYEMARYQLGDSGQKDKQRLGAVKQYDTAPSCEFLGGFFEKYTGDIPFTCRREGNPRAARPSNGRRKPFQRPSEALPKPLPRASFPPGSPSQALGKPLASPSQALGKPLASPSCPQKSPSEALPKPLASPPYTRDSDGDGDSNERRATETSDGDRKEHSVGLAPDRAPGEAVALVEQQPSDSAEVLAVFDHYRRHHPKAHPKPASSSKEWRAVKARLREGITVARLCQAIDGMHLTPHNLGENDRNQQYLGLELCMRSASQVERFAETAERGPPIAMSAREAKGHRAAEQWLAMHREKDKRNEERPDA